MNRVAAVSCSALLVCVPDAAAESSWDPGNPTTASLPGEAGASDDLGPAGGAYGRFDGDLALSVQAGVELAQDPTRALARLAAHYYSMAGPYLSLRAPLTNSEERAAWLGSAGIDLKPLFIPRWAMDLEHGPAFVDLMIDSLAISAGSFVGLGESSTRTRAAGFELGMGAGLPLLGTAAGPWFEARYLLSWRHSGAPSPSVWLALSWHFMVNTPLSSQTRG
jgi:hypothetical protein